MVYKQNFVVALKVWGKVLRESGDRVLLPFGAEYSILVKNLNAVRAKFQVAVDGQDATSGTWIIVPANGQVELERFIRNGNWQSGNRFKFIERTGEIEAHRGVGAEDGLVRVEFQAEIVRPVFYDVPVPHWPKPTYPYITYGGLVRSSRTLRPQGTTGNPGPSGFSSFMSMNECSVKQDSALSGSAGAAATPTATFNDAGITVGGSVSSQQFVQGDYFETGPSEVIVLHLRGKLGARAVQTPITVKTEIVCSSCGRKYKTGQPFCANCGTALELV